MAGLWWWHTRLAEQWRRESFVTVQHLSYQSRQITQWSQEWNIMYRKKTCWTGGRAAGISVGWDAGTWEFCVSYVYYLIIGLKKLPCLTLWLNCKKKLFYIYFYKYFMCNVKKNSNLTELYSSFYRYFMYNLKNILEIRKNCRIKKKDCKLQVNLQCHFTWQNWPPSLQNFSVF